MRQHESSRLVDENTRLRARLAELEAERDVERKAANVMTELQREFAARAERAESRLAELEGERDRLLKALAVIEGPASDGDPHIEHYRAAGGGFGIYYWTS